MGSVGGWFEPGDDVGRACDEAEAILLACEDLDAVMETIRGAESPVEARRALKLGFGFTGRQAALLLTLPVLSFTRSERDRMHAGRRARMELLADVTGVIPAVREPEPGAPQESLPPAPEVMTDEARPSYPDPHAAGTTWGAEFDGALDRLRSAMDAEAIYGAPVSHSAGHPVNPVGGLPAAHELPGAPEVTVRRSRSGLLEEAAVVLDEQVGELCDALAELLQVEGSPGAWLDDPRASDSRTGTLLDSCGIDDAVGIRTLFWHMRRTGIDSVEGLLPFADPLSPAGGFDEQAIRFEHAMTAGGLGSEPGGEVTWAGRLWPIAERLGYGYAVNYRSGLGAGAVWAYGGDEPLHRVWDSVVDLLVELYQAFTTGEPCDAAIPAVASERVVWTNLS